METQLGAIRDDTNPAEQAERGYKFATAMLLLEMTRADFDVKDTERHAVTEAVRKGFGLSAEETQSLVELAESEIDHATSLHEFTRLINEQLPIEKKRHVVELLWKVAYADGELDKYEDHFVRKIADLLHVRHRDLIQAKHRVQAEVGQKRVFSRQSGSRN